VTVGRIHII